MPVVGPPAGTETPAGEGGQAGADRLEVGLGVPRRAVGIWAVLIETIAVLIETIAVGAVATCANAARAVVGPAAAARAVTAALCDTRAGRGLGHRVSSPEPIAHIARPGSCGPTALSPMCQWHESATMYGSASCKRQPLRREGAWTDINA